MTNAFEFHPTATKIVSRKEAAAQVAKWRSEGRTIAYTNGCFDIIHAGHVQTLEDARGHGDVLIVGLNSDDSARRLKGPGRPVFSERERAEMVAALSAVDLVVIFPEDSSLPLIKVLKPDVWVKGGDYVIDTVNQEERAFVESYGGQVALGRKVEGSSTTDVIARVKSLPTS
ncbi:MAG: D-glycero-beta-D-manno-heptose 1-phosphate adenylyltransferase [Armatimonadetes bacterium]|nr:D-glycero-beta-D-manno-heptose 1-phosphate adenylyltransferase [Armatimonadota bacterium]